MSLAVRPADALDGLARVLFRFRSVTPLPLLVAAVVLGWRSHIVAGPGGPLVDAGLDVLGLALALGGSLVRFLTAGFEPSAKSQTKRLEPTALHTQGLYQLVRHPLYLGNALITLGLVLIVHERAAYVMVLPAFALEYALIIRAEERLLHLTFQDAWERWAADVPRLVPRLSRLSPLRSLAGRRFDWKVALRREVNPLVAWGVCALLLWGWEWWARVALTDARALGLRVGLGALLGLLVANKVWKKVQPR